MAQQEQEQQQQESWPTPAWTTATRSPPVPNKENVFDFVIPKDGAEVYSGRMVEFGNNDNSTINKMNCSNSMLEYLFWGAGGGGRGYRNVLYDSSYNHPSCPDETQNCNSNNNNNIPGDDGNIGFVLPDSASIPEGSTITIINTCPCGMLEVFLWERSFRLVSLGDLAVFEMRAGNWKWNDLLSVDNNNNNNNNNNNETIRFDRDRYCAQPESTPRGRQQLPLQRYQAEHRCLCCEHLVRGLFCVLFDNLGEESTPPGKQQPQ